MEINKKLGKPRLKTSDIYTFNKLVNTRYFREAGLTFLRTGKYTDAPEGHADYDYFWDMEELKCRNGYRVGDLWISGRMYFYLNYIPIKKIPDRDYLEIHPHASRTKKVQSFPSFWEIDYAYWNTKELGWQNAELGIPEVHTAILKTRRGGFSFKEASDGIYNYNFFPASISTYYAATNEYLVKDGIFNKVESMLNFLNQNTAWKKNRGRINNKFHKRASYVDGDDEKGFMSELIAKVLDSPDKGRGGDSMKITFEEGGAFPNVLKAWDVVAQQVKQANIFTGQITIFGTGGTKKDEHLEGLEEIFYNPRAYDCIAFDNIWDEGLEGTDCGFFCPVHYTFEEAMDKDGNLDFDKADKLVELERERKKGSKSEKNFTAENPKTPTEALQRSVADMFPVKELKARILRLRKNPQLTEHIQEGYFERIEGKLKFNPTTKGAALNQYPAGYNGMPIDSAVMIEEHPKKGVDKKIGDDWYKICVDPYYKEHAHESDSVGCIWVQKTAFCPYGIPDMPVAWFVGRPTRKDTFHKILFYLAEYYGAKIQSEIAGGGTDIITYAKKINKMHLLHTEIDISTNKVKHNMVDYFLNMPVERKSTGLERLSEWCSEVIGADIDGNPIYRYQRLNWIMLLEEMVKFRFEGNFDCISAGIVQMIMRQANDIILAKKYNLKNNTKSIFTRPKFGQQGVSDFIKELHNEQQL